MLVQIANIYTYVHRTKMCTVCISSRIKEHVTGVKGSHFYFRHIVQTTGALTSGAKRQYTACAH